MVPLAFFDVDVAQFIVNMLAVGGGFLVGYILGGVLYWWVDRTFFRKNSPDLFHRTARIIAGLGLAFFVALLVFGRGGGGLGGGRGDGIGSGDQGSQAPPVTSETPGPEEVPPHTPENLPQVQEGRLIITILGGAEVQDMRFYVLPEDPMPRTLGEIKAAIRSRKESRKDPFSVEIRFREPNRLPRDHPAVTLLSGWVQDQNLTVVFPPDSE